MMDIIFEATMLSHFNKKTAGRTGIFRVVEEIFLQLLSYVDSVNCILYTDAFCENAIIEYLREKEIDKVEVFPNFSNSKYLSLSNCYQCNREAINYLNNTEAFQFYLRVYNKLLKRYLLKNKKTLNNGFIKSKNYIFQNNTISIIDEYHCKKNIRYFQIIYDLIPMIFLTPGTMGSKRRLEKVISTLSKDDNIFCISEYTKNTLLSYSRTIDEKKCTVLSLGASKNFYQCSNNEVVKSVRKKYGIPVSCDYILTLCNLEPRKNLEGLLRSFFDLVNSREVKDLYLVLAGSKGWDYENIFHTLNIAESEEVKKKVIFPGYIDDQDLSPLYSGALSFVFPSFYEGFGLPPLEAMQCGTPVIASNTTSIPEVVGDAGILIDPYKQDELSEAILKLYKNQTLRQDLSRKGIERAKLFSWEKTAAKMIDAYKSALTK